MGGSVSVKSDLGIGTVFRINLNSLCKISNVWSRDSHVSFSDQQMMNNSIQSFKHKNLTRINSNISNLSYFRPKQRITHGLIKLAENKTLNSRGSHKTSQGNSTPKSALPFKSMNPLSLSLEDSNKQLSLDSL